MVPKVRVELIWDHPYRFWVWRQLYKLVSSWNLLTDRLSGCACPYGLSNQGCRPTEPDIRTTPAVHRR